jgi:hypothetical protein
MDSSDYLKEIAKKLAANYYNVSLRKDEALNAKEMNPSVLSRVFTDNCGINIKDINADLHFSRNILIVGAGAAISELPFFYTGEKAINAIEDKLKFKEMYGSFDKLQRRYRSLASHYYKTVYSVDTDIQSIQSQLGFEGRLSMLLNYFDKQDVLDEIKKILDFQFLFCHFYDIAAHLFKHRFIDVIVNFNFDELLDNAIEEEMGATGMYHKIVHDSDCKPISDLMESNRLRVPIYIKPHGTISSKTSLLFTKEHYIDMSEDMRTLLHGIFMGKVGNESSGQKHINIMAAGFAMESIELNNILFSLHKQEYEKQIRYYFLTANADKEIAQFQNNFSKWKETNKEQHSDPPICRAIPSGIDIKTGKPCPSLSEHFSNIHHLTQEKFRKPFTPIGLNIHTVLAKLFPQKKLEEIGNELLDGKDASYRTYLKQRFVFHLLYELVKWKGKLAINVIINERAGKYFRQYKHILKKKSKENTKEGKEAKSELEKMPDIIKFLDENLDIKTHSNSSSPDNIYECEALFTNETNLLEDIKSIRDLMINHSLADGIINDTDKDFIFSYLKDHVYDTKIYEVSPLYNDIRHARFRHFDNEQIIPTSLNLTYKFFEYAVLKEEFNKYETWDRLYFASESGTPIFNLHKHCDSNRGKSYLEKFTDNSFNNPKQVMLLFSDDKDVKVNSEHFREPKENHESCLVSVNGLLAHFLKNNFKCKHLKGSENIHHMALFLKGNEPVFGFYFFRPEAKNRINPVWFEREGDKDVNSNDYKNLMSMKTLFEIQYDRKDAIQTQYQLRTK